jgi:hypothetical protein
MTLTRSIAAAALILAGALPVLAQPRLDLDLEAPRGAHVLGQDLYVTVTLTNRGSEPTLVPDPAAVVNTQPRFEMRGPEFPGGTTFTPSSSTQTVRTQPHYYELKPGEVLSRTIPVHEWAPVTTPGRYVLSASLSTGRGVVRAKPVRLNLSSPKVLGAALLTDSQSGEVARVSWASARLGAATLFETTQRFDSHDREWNKTGQAPIRRPKGEISGVLAVHANFSRGATGLRWRAWLGGGDLVATPAAKLSEARFELGGGRAVEPTLMGADGGLDAFVAPQATPGLAGGVAQRGDPGELQLVHFPPPGSDLRARPATITWRTALPARPVELVAALTEDGTRHVAFVCQKANTVQVYHRTVEGAWGSAEVPNARLLQGSTPALSIRGAEVEVAVLVRAARGPRVGLARVRLGGAVEVLPVGRLGSDSAGAAVAFAPNGEPSWAILLADGRVVVPGGPRRLPAPAVSPLKLFASDDGMLVLATDPHGPQLVPLH